MKTKLLMGVLMWSLLGSGLLAAEEVAGVVTDRWYVWSNGGQPAGYFHVAQTASEDPAAPVLLRHEFVVKWKQKRISLKMQTWCRKDEWFTPVKIVSEGEGDDEMGTFTATVNWQGETGKLTTVLNGRPRELELIHPTVTDFALFEIVRQLPLQAGSTLKFHSLEASELNWKKDHQVRYVGREETEVAGQKLSLHKFEHTGGGMHPAYYWVNDQHELVRILIDNRKELRQATEAEARKTLE